MAKSPEEMAQSMIANMKEKTGKTLEEWLAITQPVGLEKHGQIVKFLKSDHGITHGFANLVAHKTLEAKVPTESQDLVEIQYANKPNLKPIYDALIAIAQNLGSDMNLSPKKAYVSLRAKKQFALIQPSTKTRVDLGINLPGKDPVGRLEKSGSFNAMVSHRVRLTDVADVDDEIKSFLKEAYEAAGGA